MTYEYKCKKCGEIVEVEEKIGNQPSHIQCECGHKMDRKYSLLRIKPMTEV